MSTDETERLPWCENCGAYAVPEDGQCGECGGDVVYVEGGL